MEEFIALVGTISHAKGARDILIAMLEYYCSIGSEDHIKILINVLTSYGGYCDFNSCLMKACDGGHVTIVNLLLTYDVYGFIGALRCVHRSDSTEEIKSILYELLWSKVTTYGEETFKVACELGNMQIVQKLMNITLGCIDEGLDIACQWGQQVVVEFLLSKLVTPNAERAFGSACHYGHISIAKLLLVKIQRQNVNWRSCLCDVCAYGDIEFVQLVLKNIEVPPSDMIVCYEYGFVGACNGGHQAIAELMISLLGANMTIGFYTVGLLNACYNGRANIAKFIIAASPQKIELSPHSFYEACKSGNQELVETIIDYSDEEPYWGDGIRGAYQGEHYHILKLMDPDVITDEYLYMGCMFNDVPMMEDSIKKTVSIRREPEWNFGFIGACRGGHLPLVELMMKKARFSGVNINIDLGIKNAIKKQQWHVVSYLLERAH